MQVSGKVLICDSIDQVGIDSLRRAGMTVDYMPEIKVNELISSVKDYDVIIVRSRTKISDEIINAATNTKIIARVGVGLDNIDVKGAESRNIRVINGSRSGDECRVRTYCWAYDIACS